jgi:hypothetical protein
LILLTVALLATSVAAASASPVPSVEAQRIVAEFGRTYVPASLPAGYIYIRWSALPGSADVWGDSLQIEFGKHGRLIIWTVEDSHDPQASSYDDCVKHNRFRDRVIHARGQTVSYIGGAVGQSATVCLRDGHALVVWNRYSLSASRLAHMVATPRVIG